MILVATNYWSTIRLPIKHIFLCLVFFVTAVKAHPQPDTICIAQLLKDGSHYIEKPGNNKTDLDSALLLLNKALSLSRSIRSDRWTNATLLWMGDAYLEGNRLAPGEACFQEVIGYYRRKGDRRREADTWWRLAECMTIDSPKLAPERARCIEQARILFEGLGDTLNAIGALKEEANTHFFDGRLDLAEKQLIEVLEKYKAIHFRHLHYTYDLLRAVSRLKGNLVNEVFYSTEMVRSLDSSDGKDHPIVVAGLYLSAGVAFASAGMWDRSLIYSRRGWLLNDGAEPDLYYAAMWRIVSGLLHVDSTDEALNVISATTRKRPPESVYHRELLLLSTASCYSAMRDYVKAEAAFSKLATLAGNDRDLRRLTDVEIYLQMMLNVGNFFVLTHRFDKAHSYTKELQRMSGGPVTLDMRAKIERLSSQVDSAMGRYDLALMHFETYQQMSDSLSGVQKTIQIQELQLKYSIEEKDKDIRLQTTNIQLLTKENQVQHAQVTQARTVRNMMIAGILLLLLIIGLVYNRYRLKQQKNLQLESKQEEITAKNRQLEINQQEITAKNYELQRLLDENEWLLREVHHRVKNNLQVIMSLLKSQVAFLRDEGALKVVLESQHRIYAMSLIHQKLYKSNDAFNIGMPEYIGDLVEYLRYSFEVSGKVSFDLHVQSLNLDVNQAIPVGLILNEIITNSFKYAFPWSDNDRITVQLTASNERWITLFIADNGRGLPDGLDPAQVKSFGMQLIAGLSEDLGGFLTIDGHQGTAYRIQFRQEELRKISQP